MRVNDGNSLGGQDGGVASVPRINIAIFCENQQTGQVLYSASSDRRMAKAHVAIQLGGVNAAVHTYSNQVTPNVVVLEVSGDRGHVMAELQRFAEVCSPDTKVIVIGQLNDVVLYRELIANGVSDYLVMPFSPVQFVSTLSTMFADPRNKFVGRVVAFVGAKGGVGSSTIAHHVGYGISQYVNLETIITDLDLSYGTSALNFNQPASGSIYEAISQPDRVDSVLIERLMTKIGNKLNLLYGPCTIEREVDLQPAAVAAVMDVVRHAAPMVVVDVPLQWNTWVKQTLLQADDIVITANPDLTNLRNVKNFLDTIGPSRSNDRQPLLVINQVGIPKRPEIPAADFAKHLNLQASAIIAHDPVTFGASLSEGKMVFEVAPKSKAAETLMQLSEIVAGRRKKQDSAAANSGGLAGLLDKLPILKKKVG